MNDSRSSLSVPVDFIVHTICDRMEPVDQHVGLGHQFQQLARLAFHVEIDDAFAAMQQVEVFGRDLQPARPAHPHHVGAEVREHHRGMWTRANAAEFDHFHPGKRSGVGHRSNVTQPPFLTFSTCSRSPSVAASTPPFIARLSMNPGSGTDRSTVMSNRTFVLSPSGVSV